MATVTEPCTLEIDPKIWDLGGTMTATFADPSDPDEPVGFLDANQPLQVTVTVTLTGKIVNYLCDTWLCVCLSFEACGCPSYGCFPEWIELTGNNSPCKTNKFTFVINVPANTFDPGECGRRYTLCITLGSKDCCGKVGFLFGTCHDYSIDVTPAVTDSPDAAATAAPDAAATASTGAAATDSPDAS
jgi:hypothetical protein